MAYDMSADHAEFLGGANDFSHARLAKKLMEGKRAAKAGPPAEMPPEEGAEGAPEGGEGLALGGDVDEAAEAIVPEGGEGGEKIPVEVTPEELAMLEQLRASKAAPEAPPMDDAPPMAIKRGGPPRL